MEFNSLSVIVPAYNEASRIQPTLEKLAAHLEQSLLQYEIIVIDDGSTDSTAETVLRLAAGNAHILLRSLPENHGKGCAVREGITMAKGDAVLFTDADLSTPVEAIDLAIAELKGGFAIVIGSRRHPDSVIARRQSRAREVIGRIFNRVVRTLFSLPFKDTQCGFKCFTGVAAKEIFARASIDTFSFDVEVLMIAMNLGYTIKEIPVCWTNAPDSKVRAFHDTATIVRELFTLWRKPRMPPAAGGHKPAE